MLTKILLILIAIITILIVLGTHTLQYADHVDLRALAFSIFPKAVKTTTDGQHNDKSVEGMTHQRSEPDKKSVHAADPDSELKSSSKSSFCSSTPNDKSELERKCGKLTAKNCKDIDCCLLLNGAKCVTGDADGPTFASDHLSSSTPGDDFWYYKKSCYGKKCPS